MLVLTLTTQEGRLPWMVRLQQGRWIVQFRKDRCRLADKGTGGIVPATGRYGRHLSEAGHEPCGCTWI